tara:strand:- start:62 stop:268 length:207 start_codon:yes stop_codon:yes gene_type:complete
MKTKLSEIQQLELVCDVLEKLKLELNEDFFNCKDQWHDPETGYILTKNMKALDCVVDEVRRKMSHIEY